jgi:membrane dipeptidase
MKIIDMHSDALMYAMLDYGMEADMYSMPKAVTDIVRMRRGGVAAQFFAIQMITEYNYINKYGMEPIPEDEYIEGCCKIFYGSLEKHSDIVAQAQNADDVLDNMKAGKLSAILTMEDGVAVHGDMGRIKKFYDMGVRVLTPGWKFKNCFCKSDSGNPQTNSDGLTPFGIEAVKYMQDLGMIVDVSHLSDGAFYDVAEVCKKPYVATHSNCRKICPHWRNLTDDMIKTISESGGVVGINVVPQFLYYRGQAYGSILGRVIEMIAHMKKVGGIDVIAIGADFCEMSCKNSDISGSEDFPILVDELERRHYTPSEIDKITHGNIIRVMRDCLI